MWVFLSGPLGAGKTTLMRYILQAMGVSGRVKSPTYTLVEPYTLREGIVYHFDLYRLESPEQLETIGIRDYLDQKALCCIEWPEKGQGYLPDCDLMITLSFKHDPEHRQLTVKGETEQGQALVKAL
jgi:tRNA threonylcarbamoyladenosine biosynthesis protein TsaE